MAASRASSSTLASTRRKNGSKKTSQASRNVTPCLARLLAALSVSHSKAWPPSSSWVFTRLVYIHCIYASIGKPNPNGSDYYFDRTGCAPHDGTRADVKHLQDPAGILSRGGDADAEPG